MDFERNGNEYGVEKLARDRLRDAVRETLRESADKAIIDKRDETRFKCGHVDVQIACEFDNGRQYLVQYNEEIRKREISSWKITLTTLNTEDVSHRYGSLITSESVVLSNLGLGLPYLYRSGPIPDFRPKEQFLFPEGEVADPEMLEELRQGIRSAFVLPLHELDSILAMRGLTSESTTELKRIAFGSVGAFALYMVGVKSRSLANRIKTKR
jgi:hypothetical protein